jgi:L-ribulose-5-phosphate 3-epimerase
MITRRDCLKLTGGAALTGASRSAAAGKLPVRFGSMQGSLTAKPSVETFEVARRVGLAGVELNIGRVLPDGKMPLADAALQKQYMEAARTNSLTIAGVVLDVFHPHGLKDDPAAPAFLPEGIAIARAMQAGVLLLPFFGKSALANRGEMGRVADILKEHVGAAEKAGILLGLEDTIPAEDNAWIMDRVGSRALKVYYDVGNATNLCGFDAPKEIRWLGGQRICQIHIKDKEYMGEGKVNFTECFRAIRDSGYKGYLNFETSAPSGNKESDLSRNLAFARKTLQAVEAEA